jgi:hypothetical protein
MKKHESQTGEPNTNTDPQSNAIEVDTTAVPVRRRLYQAVQRDRTHGTTGSGTQWIYGPPAPPKKKWGNVSRGTTPQWRGAK